MAWEFTLCASYLLSDGCGKWTNLDAIRKMAIIRMDGKFGKPGCGALPNRWSQGDFACLPCEMESSVRVGQEVYFW
jgi:hypothetical protein